MAPAPPRAPDGATVRPLDELVQQIQRRWGSRALHSGAPPAMHPPALSTGDVGLDRLLGGGLRRGALTELNGRGTSGRRTTALRAAAVAQRAGEPVAYLDLLHAFDPLYAAHCGLHLPDLLLVRPREPTTSLAVALDLLSTGIGVLVVDALAPLLATSEGRAALRRFARRLAAPLATSPCSLLIIAPERAAAPDAPFPTAHAVLHHRHLHWLRRGRDITGYQSRITLLHGPSAPPGSHVTLSIPLPDRLSRPPTAEP